MPRVRIMDPTGLCYEIATRQTETLLRAWFDEVLPHTWLPGRPGVDDFDVLWPRIFVQPMWAWKTGCPSDPDWLCDTRVIGRLIDFPAMTGDEGLTELLRLRQGLERELAEMRPS